jgi:aminoglycoside phosphotransferase (APT) family kinase protein
MEGAPVAYFAKLERPAKAAAWERLRPVLAQGFEGSPALAMAEFAGGDPAHGLSIAKEVPGVPLAELLAGAEAAPALERLGRALHDLESFARDPRLVALLPPYDFTAARAELDRFARLSERFALPAAELVVAGSALLASLGEVDSGRRAVVHRDLHDGQVIVGHRITLLDLAGASLGDPALDFGNLLAHLRLRHLQGRLFDPPAKPGAALLAGADRSAEWRRAVSAAEALSLFRLAAVYALRPCWQHLSGKLAHLGQAVLTRIQSPASTAGARS